MVLLFIGFVDLDASDKLMNDSFYVEYVARRPYGECEDRHAQITNLLYVEYDLMEAYGEYDAYYHQGLCVKAGEEVDWRAISGKINSLPINNTNQQTRVRMSNQSIAPKIDELDEVDARRKVLEINRKENASHMMIVVPATMAVVAFFNSKK